MDQKKNNNLNLQQSIKEICVLLIIKLNYNVCIVCFVKVSFMVDGWRGIATSHTELQENNLDSDFFYLSAVAAIKPLDHEGASNGSAEVSFTETSSASGRWTIQILLE